MCQEEVRDEINQPRVGANYPRECENNKRQNKKDKGSSVPKDFTLEAFYMVWNEKKVSHKVYLSF